MCNWIPNPFVPTEQQCQMEIRTHCLSIPHQITAPKAKIISICAKSIGIILIVLKVAEIPHIELNWPFFILQHNSRHLSTHLHLACTTLIPLLLNLHMACSVQPPGLYFRDPTLSSLCLTFSTQPPGLHFSEPDLYMTFTPAFTPPLHGLWLVNHSESIHLAYLPTHL